jgi:hypothetical protein
METDEFMNWLADELRKLVQIPPNANRFGAAKGIVDQAINKLMDLSQTNRKKIIDEIENEERLGKIGDYRLPYDIRDDIDIIGEVLATLEGLE